MVKLCIQYMRNTNSVRWCDVFINYHDIGKRIRDVRVSKNMTQEKLAEIADLSIAHVSHIETGNTKLSLPAIVNIANALVVSLDTLLCDNLTQSTVIYTHEITQLVMDCDEKELRIISEIVKATKTSLRKTYKSGEQARVL